MNDESRKRLTEYLGECWHIPTPHLRIIFLYGGDICRKCGERGDFHDGQLNNRPFTTGNDMLDLKYKIAEKGEWKEFIHHCIATEQVERVMSFSEDFTDLTTWLFTMPRFAELVDEWLKGKEAKDG